MKKNVYVLYGGISAEHEVSIRSGKTIIQYLDRNKYDVHPIYINKKGVWHPLGITGPDVQEEDLVKSSDLSIAESIADFLHKDFDSSKENVFFSVLHGTIGEDGAMQGFLKTLNVPFTGNGVLSSAVTMDKGITNRLLAENDISQAKFMVLDRWSIDSIEDIDTKKIIEKLGLPVYVKPCNAGSSVGITHVKKEEEFKEAFELAFKYDTRVLLEEEVLGVEVELTVVGNKTIRASLPGSYMSTDVFLDYDGKYNTPDRVPEIPYPKDEKTQNELRKLAVKAYKACSCMGFARVDIFIRKDDGALLVNEINTLPGMTTISLAQRLWEETYGLDYPAFMDMLIELAEEAHKERNSLVVDRS
ncbi:D-alanine--D-alanine ligase family protein [Gallicola sp. Sow4_E12]|uniref:D-alanine--D-alanine ligase family protein n=1 Tax=Gallicola sp. Sow4_E12 TaxID=3438785 RepID=UPI003F8E73B5